MKKHFLIFENLTREKITFLFALKTLVLHFSNPNVKYQKNVTGTNNEFNACVVQQNGCPISTIIK